MKQIEIAKKLKVKQPYISLILTGKRPMQWDLAKKLSELFGNDPSFWMDASPSEMETIINNNQ